MNKITTIDDGQFERLSTGTKINVFRFDYDGVPSMKAAALRAEASRIRKLLRSTVPTIIEVGHALFAAKEQVGHGKFSDWVDAECGFSLSSAENYMRVAEKFGDKIATVANLSPTTVYRLAAKSTPPSIVEAALQRAAKGEVISDDCVAVAVSKAKFERQQAAKKKRAQKRRVETIKRKKAGAQDPFADLDEEENDYENRATPPAVVEDNILYGLQRINENARVFNKILRASALDREAADRINTALDSTISKLRSIKSTLEKTQTKIVETQITEHGLRERAKRLGYRIKRRGAEYTAIHVIEGSAFGGADIEAINKWFDVIEYKPPVTISSACGVPLFTINAPPEKAETEPPTAEAVG